MRQIHFLIEMHFVCACACAYYLANASLFDATDITAASIGSYGSCTPNVKDIVIGASLLQLSKRPEITAKGEFVSTPYPQRKIKRSLVSDIPKVSCGFTTECSLDYRLTEVNDTIARPWASEDYLQAVHDHAREACIGSATNYETILENGGWCYDLAKSGLVQSKLGIVDVDYHLPFYHVVADEVTVSVLAEKVLLRQNGSCCYTLSDLGAGVGQFGHALKARLPQLEYYGYDGAGNVEEFTKNYVKFVDLTLPLNLKQTDWVISSEVGENIPHEYEARLIANIHAHNCRGVILTWAIVGQAGHGHVNCHSNEYLIKIFEALGYKKNEELTLALRVNRTRNKWLERSSLAFERINKLSTCH